MQERINKATLLTPEPKKAVQIQAKQIVKLKEPKQAKLPKTFYISKGFDEVLCRAKQRIVVEDVDIGDPSLFRST